MRCTFCGNEAYELTATRRSDKRITPVCQECMPDCRKWKKTWDAPAEPKPVKET